MGTRTHTVYWDEESLTDLEDAYQQLVEETHERINYITDLDVIDELYRRLNLLRDVIGLMGEKAS